MTTTALGSILVGSTDPERLRSWYRAAFAPDQPEQGPLNVGGVLEQFDRPARLLGAPANKFVADFLGKDRQLRRLSLMTVADAELVSQEAEGLPEIKADTNLRSALDDMLETGQRRLLVRDGDAITGVLTLEAIMHMWRAL